MTCIEYRQQLEQSFGQTQPETGVFEHLIKCAECRSYWEQLTRLAQDVPNDFSFEIDADTIDRLAQRVDQAIELSRGTTPNARRDIHGISPWNLMRLVPAAAALLIVFGVGLGGYFVGLIAPKPNTVANGQSAESLMTILDESDYSEPDDPTYHVLLSDYATDRSFDASEKLLDDITDEELEYLAKNFDVGDLL